MLACLNVCSVGNKSVTLSRLIVDEQLDLLAITETWHERSESTELRRLTPPGYRCIDAARPLPPGANVDTLGFRNYGSLAFICRQSVRLQKKHLDASPTTFEFLCGSASTASCHFILLCLYRTDSQALSVIVGELSEVFDELAIYQGPVLICCNFNVHVDVQDDTYAVQLAHPIQCVALFNTSLVAQATHKDGHTLDLVLTRKDTTACELHVGGLISDHAPVFFRLCAASLLHACSK